MSFKTDRSVGSFQQGSPALLARGGKLLLAMLLGFEMTGCGVMHLNAPPQSQVRLMSKSEPAEIKVERHAWFKYWGGEPFNPEDVNASTIIQEQGLKEARIQMTNTFVDGIYSIIPGMFGFPRRTLIVEGNRVLHTPDGAVAPQQSPADHGTETKIGVAK